ncbi:MAG: undecaprenyldiphospho-muramoylpentapeptide beta-N-acetylglucosaminyltransferase [Pseudomonadota bacterium]|nr:undecaprenyldiphospho-muramoylpentapeptide beta-N-acetylglucosaminyltransferase [Pseudomonadota bacterium]
MNMNPPLILLAAGGTGGHIFPAEALAEELLDRGFAVELVSDERGSRFGAPGRIRVHRVRAATLGSGVRERLSGVSENSLGFIQARRLIGRVKPALVAGFGGYASIPTVAAAASKGTPILLHEQNAVLGRANRTMERVADKIALSFPEVDRLRPEAKDKIVVTGNPVRPAVARISDIPYPKLETDGVLALLVMGGSQGARVFAHTVPEALALLPEHLRRRIRLMQQCRAEDLELVRSRLEEIGVIADLATFFVDVPERLAQCHAVIGRAGASTVAEVTVCGRPSILVPLPTSADDHQKRNAEAVARAGAGWPMPQDGFTPEALAVRLEEFLAWPSNLIKAACAARAWGRPDAARNLADVAVSMVSDRKKVRRIRPFDLMEAAE